MECFTQSLLRVLFLGHSFASSAKHLSRQVMWTLHNFLPENRHSLKYTNRPLKDRGGNLLVRGAKIYLEMKDKEDPFRFVY